MSRMWILTKLFLKTSLGVESKVKKSDKKLIYIILSIIIIPIVLGMVSALVLGIYGVLRVIGQQGLILAMGYSITATIIFIFGIISVMSVLYFAKDIEYILPLPFKAHEVSLAKFTTVLIYQYITVVAVLGPITLIYGIGEGCGVLYYLISLVCLILIPIIPTLYSAVISMILMRFTGISKHKDVLKFISGFLALLFGVGINILSSSMGRKLADDSEALKRVVEAGNNSLVNGISDVFITPKLATLATMSSDINKSLINIGLFVLVNILAIIIFIIIADNLYLKGLVGISESFSKREKLSAEKLSKNITQNSLLKTWIIKELRLLFRTPAYVLNCISTIILIPVILVIPILSDGGISGILGNSGFLRQPSSFNIIIGIFFGAIAFITGLNPTAPTAISREGDMIFISKYLPVSYVTQIMAKIISAVIINYILVIIVLIGFMVVGMPITLILLLAIIGLLEIAFLSAVGVLIDLHSPKLVWDNEQKAVKQNFNVFISMLISIPFAGIGAGAVIFINEYFAVSFAVLAVVLLLGNLLMFNLIRTSGVKKFRKIAED